MGLPSGGNCQGVRILWDCPVESGTFISIMSWLFSWRISDECYRRQKIFNKMPIILQKFTQRTVTIDVHEIQPLCIVRYPLLYTMHPSLCTRHLHPAPCTQYPTPGILRPAFCVLHPTPCTQHPAPSTLHLSSGELGL